MTNQPWTSVSMRRTLLRSALVLGLAAAAGCTSFLNGDKLSNDPNNPQVAGLDNLFVSSQTNITVQLTGQLSRTVCIWMQQCSGQVSPFNSISVYAVGEDDYYSVWSALYGGGGLIDLRNVQTRALERGDSIYAAQATILEALLITTGADVWGDIPYSQAADPKVSAPALDKQQAVYDSSLHALATAITWLSATSETNIGAGGADLVYGGDPSLWTALAYTLRARIFMHEAKVLGKPVYDSAFDNAQSGIAPGNDYVSINASATQSANLWAQFNTIYQGYMGAGRYLVDYMNDSSAAPDPRLAQYFEPNDDGDFVGADPGQIVQPSVLSTFAAARVDNAFLQPLVTAAENQLIAAEAALGKTTPDAGAAATFLHAEQDAAGVPQTAANLHNVMLEKYVALFQNVEVWSDWRRTNLPHLVPASGGSIPRRLVYPLSERQVNPSITDPGPARNWNDP